MGNPSLALRFNVFVSHSLSVSRFAPSSIYKKPFSSSTSLPPTTRATSSDLLNHLGSESQASAVHPVVAKELESCFKFLVPFTPNRSIVTPTECSTRRSLGSSRFSSESETDNHELIWRPPESVLELARLAVDSRGDPGAIQRTLDPTVISIPDVHGSKQQRCELTRTPYGRRFISEELNSYLEILFELIVAECARIGLDIRLNRFDLFHGHLFIAFGSRRLGILFHAKEYPAYDEEAFPYKMGYCQIGSNVLYDDSMNLRNILWLATNAQQFNYGLGGTRIDETVGLIGVLVVLDARPDGIIYRDIIPEYAHFARTIYEGDLGDVVVDVNYLDVGSAIPNYQLFVC